MAAPIRHVGLFISASRFRLGSFNSQCRFCSSIQNKRKGLVLGVYEGDKENEVILTNAAEKFQQMKATNLLGLIQMSGLASKKGKQRVFYGLDSEYASVAVVSLGKRDVGYNVKEELEEGRENVRIGVAAGVRQLKEVGVTSVYVDPCGDPEAAAEGANLCVYSYDELKTEKKNKPPLKLQCYTEAADSPDSITASWTRGVVLAEGQILSKRLMEAPANVCTPTFFADVATEKLGALDNVTVTVRDKAWAEEKKMGSYLSVTRGSEEPPKFVEIHYRGGKEGDAPIALVGKGITFDSGGISIKAAASMEDMRGDMGGAACVVGAIYSAAKNKVAANVMGFIPLCENMPSGTATKPGDVVTAMNGKTIEVDNTDAEGRLVLCDALCYAQTFKPCAIIDLATLTGAMIVALGSAATGVWTHSNLLWTNMHTAGQRTGDRVWRMPLFKHYTKTMKDCHLADLTNTGGRWGGACNAAAFLQEFVEHEHWMHMDIAGVTALMGCKADSSYSSATVTGRPTRTLAQFITNMNK